MWFLYCYRSEDDLTHKLAEIIKANNRVKRQEQNGAPQHILRELVSLLQFHITTYFDNTKPGMPVAQQRSGRYVKTEACDDTLSIGMVCSKNWLHLVDMSVLFHAARCRPAALGIDNMRILHLSLASWRCSCYLQQDHELH